MNTFFVRVFLRKSEGQQTMDSELIEDTKENWDKWIQIARNVGWSTLTSGGYVDFPTGGRRGEGYVVIPYRNILFVELKKLTQ